MDTPTLLPAITNLQLLGAFQTIPFLRSGYYRIPKTYLTLSVLTWLETWPFSDLIHRAWVPLREEGYIPPCESQQLLRAARSDVIC